MSGTEDFEEYKYYVEKFYVLPLELKDDIIYCQRAMRDFLKVHTLVSEVFKEQADADPVQMRRILDELEDEVYEINAEHQFLMLRLNDDLDEFHRKLQENNIASVPAVLNEFVSNQIVPLIADASYQISPHSVVSRANEEMLIRKHFLLSQDDEAGVPPLKLSELDENIPLMLAPPVLGLGQQIAAARGPKTHWAKMNEVVPPHQSQSQAELTHHSQRISKSDAIESSLSAKRKNISCSSPPPLAPITPTVMASQIPPFDAVAQRPTNLHYALKRARKTKQQPRSFCDDEVMELTSLEFSRLNKIYKDIGNPSSPPLSPAASKITKSNAAAASSQVQSNALTKKSTPHMTVQMPAKNYKARNIGRKSSPNPQSNSQLQPAGSTSGSSDDSSAELQQEQKRLFASAAQWRDEPRETRILPSEYGQESFLGLFGLYTPEVVKKLNQRHSKRKRRTVQNASGVDFHYGQQLSAMETLVLGVRGHKKCKDKPEFLLSPKEKRLQAKRAYNRKRSGSTGIGDAPSVGDISCQHGESSSSKCRKCRECKECKHRVEREPVVFCQTCSGFYHIECHEPPKSRNQIQAQSNRCPPCLREQAEKLREGK
ncbi:uncharacterized protein Lint-1 [Drosophila kikkawai]|uniref:Uncharacterized protein LOC108074131 n=1 Tax=Drosophila kikkawai TaxID=30033 RepID=A0A6P4I095_DROKI|nr:uncharacterized protein LOC108074131 [Drosophila kikkawai]XP_041631024.1 uncharacterized protein LOC108074131 [Drosophila kikkawai]